MNERKTKTLIYRRAHFHSDPGATMQSLLHAALEKKSTIGERRESIGPMMESPIWRLIGDYQSGTNIFFGILMRYMPGTSPQTLIEDADAQRVTIEQLSVPVTDDGKRRELLEGTLFFAAIDNHLVLMQSIALQSDHLEKHLLWLLHDAGALAGDNSFQLLNQLPKAVRAKLERQPVRQISLGGALMTPSNAASDRPHDDLASSSAVIHGNNDANDGMLDAIRAFLSPTEAAKLKLDALDGSNIEYTLRLRYRGATTNEGQALMDTLGSALRHSDEVVSRITLVGGGEILGSEMRLTKSIRINTYNGAPAITEIFEEMRQWLLDKLTSEDIEV